MVVISNVTNMFWGVTIDAGKFYSQTVTQGFHLSMAALEPGSASKDHVQVMLQNGSSEFLLCSLHQDKLIQQPLDLVFASGEELSFSLTGKGVVHLTGYLLEDQPEDYDDYSDGEEESYDEEESDAPQLVEIDADMLKSGSKRKAIDALSPAKKQKFLEALENEDDDDEDDDDYNEGDDDDDDDDDLSEDFSEDELTFDEDDDSDLDDEDDMEEEDDEEEVQNKSAKKSPVKTPKGDNTGSAKKDKTKGKIETTPQKGAKTPEKKENSQKKQKVKAPETPTTPANGETPSKKKKKKSKDGDASMNESTASTPGKSSTESTPKSAKKQKEGTPKANTPGKRSVLAGGTVIEELKVGHGPEAKAGKMVSVYYVGTLSKNNKQFDSCNKGKPFKFRLKQGEVIKGWDNGVEGMKVGGKRKITVPASQAYGNLRQGPIPPNSSLTFEVELKAIS